MDKITKRYYLEYVDEGFCPFCDDGDFSRGDNDDQSFVCECSCGATGTAQGIHFPSMQIATSETIRAEVKHGYKLMEYWTKNKLKAFDTQPIILARYTWVK